MPSMPSCHMTHAMGVIAVMASALAACEPSAPLDPAVIDAAAAPDIGPDYAPPPDLGFLDMHASTREPFEPIGTPVDAAVVDAAPDATVEPGEQLPLKLAFEPLEQNSGALRLTALAFLPEPRGDFLTLDKDGELIHMRLVEDGDTVRAERVGGVWLDEVYSYSDAGLISIALAPDFVETGHIYLGFSTDRRTNVIKRYTFAADALAEIEATGVEIIRIHADEAPQPWHNVGSIGFTETGEMWALFGDKKLRDTAQDLTLPLGALLRFTPSAGQGGGYVVPDDNPFADGTGHPAIYAKGLRSPWTAHYHDGRWFIGDVGRDTVEEVNRLEAPGENFGWPFAEGACVPTPAGEPPPEGEPTITCEGLIDPWSAWARDGGPQPFRQDDPQASPSGRRSVYIGAVYRPGLYDAPDPYLGRWRDVITYGDTFVGFVRAAPVDAERGEGWHAGHLRYATGWAQAPDGHIYVVTLGTWPQPDEDADAPLAGIWRAVLADPPAETPADPPAEPPAEPADAGG